MIAGKNRFHGHGSLKYVFKNGRAVRSKQMTFRVIENPRRKHTRLAVVVSKKVHKSAIGRNRIRRRMYELLRRNLPDFGGVYDIALIVTSSEVMTSEAALLEKNTTELLRQAGLYKTP